MQALSSSETSVYICQATRRNIQEDSHLCTHSKSLNSAKCTFMFYSLVKSTKLRRKYVLVVQKRHTVRSKLKTESNKIFTIITIEICEILNHPLKSLTTPHTQGFHRLFETGKVITMLALVEPCPPQIQSSLYIYIYINSIPLSYISLIVSFYAFVNPSLVSFHWTF